MLLIDAGNTKIKVAYAGEFDQSWFVVREGATGDALNHKVIKLLDGAHKPPLRVVLGCVADSALADMFADQCRIRWGIEAETLRSSSRFGEVRNGYHQPEQLGVDRWAVLIAGWMRVRSSVVVISCGTAITIDTVLSDGSHQGGVILPGIRIAEESFYRHTGNQSTAVVARREVFAKETSAAVANGVFWSVVGGIRTVVERIVTQIGFPPAVLLTGGDAERIYPYVRGFLAGKLVNKVETVDHLVFEGMQWLADQ